MIRILIATLLAVVLQFSVSAQNQRSETIQKLYEFTQDVLSDNLAPVRGGTKNRPLGCYLGSKDDVQYRSGYKDVEPRTQCEWAYHLHQYVVQNGGGWNNYQKYSKETTPVSSDATSILSDSLRSYAGGKDPKDAWERAHIPYDKQAAFADKWWKKNSRAYSSTVVPPKGVGDSEAVTRCNAPKSLNRYLRPPLWTYIFWNPYPEPTFSALTSKIGANRTF